jgi:hypothetical protein
MPTIRFAIIGNRSSIAWWHPLCAASPAAAPARRPTQTAVFRSRVRDGRISLAPRRADKGRKRTQGTNSSTPTCSHATRLLLQPLVVLAVLQLHRRCVADLGAQGLELGLLAQASVQRVEVLRRAPHESHLVVLNAVVAAASEGQRDLSAGVMLLSAWQGRGRCSATAKIMAGRAVLSC